LDGRGRSGLVRTKHLIGYMVRPASATGSAGKSASRSTAAPRTGASDYLRSDNSISGRTLLVPERLCASRQRPQTALSRCRELYASRLLGFYPLSPGWFGAPLVLRGYPVITA